MGCEFASSIHAIPPYWDRRAEEINSAASLRTLALTKDRGAFLQQATTRPYARSANELAHSTGCDLIR